MRDQRDVEMLVADRVDVLLDLVLLVLVVLDVDDAAGAATLRGAARVLEGLEKSFETLVGHIVAVQQGQRVRRRGQHGQRQADQNRAWWETANGQREVN